MSTAASPAASAQMRLPHFEGYKIPRARLAFVGAYEIDLVGSDDRELVEALKLGAEATVTVSVDGVDHVLVLGARVVRRGHRLRKQEESEQAISDYRIAINHRSLGPEAGDE
jgi:hypothetical protein